MKISHLNSSWSALSPVFSLAAMATRSSSGEMKGFRHTYALFFSCNHGM